MAYILPENLTRLRATTFVQDAELDRIGRVLTIRAAAENMAEYALRKILKDCIRTVGDYQGHPGSVLELDCYILTHQELLQLISEARLQGASDFERERFFR